MSWDKAIWTADEVLEGVPGIAALIPTPIRPAAGLPAGLVEKTVSADSTPITVASYLRPEQVEEYVYGWNIIYEIQNIKQMGMPVYITGLGIGVTITAISEINGRDKGITLELLLEVDGIKHGVQYASNLGSGRDSFPQARSYSVHAESSKKAISNFDTSENTIPGTDGFLLSSTGLNAPLIARDYVSAKMRARYTNKNNSGADATWVFTLNGGLTFAYGNIVMNKLIGGGI